MINVGMSDEQSGLVRTDIEAFKDIFKKISGSGCVISAVDEQRLFIIADHLYIYVVLSGGFTGDRTHENAGKNFFHKKPLSCFLVHIVY